MRLDAVEGRRSAEVAGDRECPLEEPRGLPLCVDAVGVRGDRSHSVAEVLIPDTPGPVWLVPATPGPEVLVPSTPLPEVLEPQTPSVETDWPATPMVFPFGDIPETFASSRGMLTLERDGSGSYLRWVGDQVSASLHFSWYHL